MASHAEPFDHRRLRPQTELNGSVAIIEEVTNAVAQRRRVARLDRQAGHTVVDDLDHHVGERKRVGQVGAATSEDHTIVDAELCGERRQLDDELVALAAGGTHEHGDSAGPIVQHPVRRNRLSSPRTAEDRSTDGAGASAVDGADAGAG